MLAIVWCGFCSLIDDSFFRADSDQLVSRQKFLTIDTKSEEGMGQLRSVTQLLLDSTLSLSEYELVV